MCGFCEMVEGVKEKKESKEWEKHFLITDTEDGIKLHHLAYEASEEISISFCPICGEKLGD